MSEGFHIVVCGSLVPDPLQTLTPIEGPTGPALKNEMMLPAVLDPWAAHALYEAAHLAKKAAGSKVWLVSLGPKAKLQQLMMTIAQKVSIRTGGARRSGRRIHRSLRGGCRPCRGDREDSRSRPLPAPALRRLRLGLP